MLQLKELKSFYDNKFELSKVVMDIDIISLRSKSVLIHSLPTQTFKNEEKLAYHMHVIHMSLFFCNIIIFLEYIGTQDASKKIITATFPLTASRSSCQLGLKQFIFFYQLTNMIYVQINMTRSTSFFG